MGGREDGTRQRRETVKREVQKGRRGWGRGGTLGAAPSLHHTRTLVSPHPTSLIRTSSTHVQEGLGVLIAAREPR